MHPMFILLILGSVCLCTTRVMQQLKGAGGEKIERPYDKQ